MAYIYAIDYKDDYVEQIIMGICRGNRLQAQQRIYEVLAQKAFEELPSIPGEILRVNQVYIDPNVVLNELHDLFDESVDILNLANAPATPHLYTITREEFLPIYDDYFSGVLAITKEMSYMQI